MAGAGNSGRLYRGLFRFWRGEYTETRSWIGIRSPSKAETLVGFALDQALGPGMTINPPWKSTGNRFCSNEFRHKRGGLFPKFLYADPGSSAAKPEVEKSSPPTACDCSCFAAGESLKPGAPPILGIRPRLDIDPDCGFSSCGCSSVFGMRSFLTDGADAFSNASGFLPVHLFIRAFSKLPGVSSQSRYDVSPSDRSPE